MKKIALLMALAVLSFFDTASAQTIQPGEKLVFSATYNMSGLLTNIAEVTMETSTVKTSKATLLRLKCTAATFSKWDNFFKIRDLYESYVNPKSLTPYLYKRDIDEGGYKKYMKYTFSHSSQKVNSIMRKRKSDGSTYEVKKTVSFSKGTKDIVSLLYYVRTLDYSQFGIGTTKNLKVLFDNEETTVHIKYLGKETIQTELGSKACYKLSVGISGKDILKGTDSNLLWLTSDSKRIPVFAKFKIPVGNGELKIKSVKHS